MGQHSASPRSRLVRVLTYPVPLWIYLSSAVAANVAVAVVKAVVHG